MKIICYISLCIIFISILACEDSNTNNTITPADPEYTLVNIYSHNTSYFTQGLEFVGDTLIEGTGNPVSNYEIKSKLIKYNYFTEEIYNLISLNDIYFGEGITVFDSIIYQLTYTSEKCFKYSLDSLKILGEFDYDDEGWGLTHDDQYIIMSNGTSTISFRDPVTFDIIKQISVEDSNDYSVSRLNELEYINEKIFANIWYSDDIVIIDPVTGYVEKRIDMSDLRSAGSEIISTNFVLNGIALHPNGNIFITGKNWPNIFEIKITNK
ncbi:MAG: glutaminyl-peptide cyclotransferase [Candidatus Delongbacteria bacterium]|jgi:glutamine cyclotransferase|nr:glutaminyl-peptide cyclotransferase [Candidatus Delongbacteria bacterium]